MSDKEWNAQAFAKHIIEGVGGMNDCERYELAVFPLGDRVAAVEWTLRCLANPECEGSAEAFAAIAEKRLGKCVWRQDDEGNWFADDPCSAGWQFITGGPSDNDMSFCPVCGRPLEAVPYKNEEVDDE
jgi:hypothetical protein